MGICLEFVFLQIFKSRSGPRTEFNNNFSERSGLGTDFIFHKPNWDFLFFLEVAALHGNFLGASPKLGRGRSSEHEPEGYQREENPEIKFLSLIPELAMHESWSNGKNPGISAKKPGLTTAAGCPRMGLPPSPP